VNRDDRIRGNLRDARELGGRDDTAAQRRERRIDIDGAFFDETTHDLDEALFFEPAEPHELLQRSRANDPREHKPLLGRELHGSHVEGLRPDGAHPLFFMRSLRW
jgi:hypothetical protein